MESTNCPICIIGKLKLFNIPDDTQYKGQILQTDVEYAVCSQCGEEMILPDQIKRNDRRIRDAWRKADGLLTGKEIIGLRNHLRLTQQQASKIFGGGANAFSKYERGEIIQSEAMDKLMRLALEKEDVLLWLKKRAELEGENYSKSEYYGNVVPFKPQKASFSLSSTLEGKIALYG